MQAGSIVSVRWRCPRQRRTHPKSAFCDGHHVFLDTGGVGRARCRTTCRRVGSHDQPTNTAKKRLGVEASDEQQVDNCKLPLDKVRSQTAGPDQCEDGEEPQMTMEASASP